MAFRASEDGFDALTFHEKVDLKVTLCKLYSTHHALWNPMPSSMLPSSSATTTVLLVPGG